MLLRVLLLVLYTTYVPSTNYLMTGLLFLPALL
jgi:hypothetical protein